MIYDYKDFFLQEKMIKNLEENVFNVHEFHNAKIVLVLKLG